MKSILHTTLRNYSKFPIDIVWENAQDLEHVAYLHAHTNQSFKLLHIDKESGSSFEYDMMIYRTVRRFFFFTFHTFGFRKIISRYNIHQMEYIPLFGMTTALNSLLISTGNPETPTMLLDEVVMELPGALSFLRNYFTKALKRHTAIQCGEDESFRERRDLLKTKGIKLPFSLFNDSHWNELCGKFKETLSKGGPLVVAR
jgi:hypothetical protein